MSSPPPMASESQTWRSGFSVEKNRRTGRWRHVDTYGRKRYFYGKEGEVDQKVILSLNGPKSIAIAVGVLMKKTGLLKQLFLFAIIILLAFSAISCSRKNNHSGRDTSENEENDHHGEHGTSAFSDETSTEEFPIYEKPSLPENTLSASDYFDQYSTVMATVNVDSSDGLLSEKQAIRYFAERGFTEARITYDFSMDGVYVGENEVSNDSDEKHPYYFTLYVTGEGSVWGVYIIEHEVIANPVSINAETGAQADVLIAETDHLISYDAETNRFFVTVPNESEIDLKTVDQITVETLDRITREGVNSL